MALIVNGQITLNEVFDGEQGEKGEKGEKGETGEKGEAGVAGKDGQNGKDGTNGKDGINGKDGKDGKDGVNGVNGKDGVDGKDGKDGIVNAVHKVRYVRDWIAGNTDNSANHWIEIKVMAGTVNRAKGITPTSNLALTNAWYVTDGSTSTSGYTAGVANNQSQYVQIDLGKVYEDIDTIRVWHWYNNKRSYNKTKTEVSADGKTWVTLFDSAKTGTYMETSEGNSIIVSTKAVTNVADNINNAVTTIDKTGITVKDGNFGLESSQGGLWYTYENTELIGTKPFKNHILTLQNHFADHSFEMLDSLEAIDGKGYYQIAPNADSFGRWGVVESPKLLSEYKTDIGIPTIPFGHQCVACDKNNYVKQAVRIQGGLWYTVSFHISSNYSLTAGDSEVCIRMLGDNIEIQNNILVKIPKVSTNFSESVRYAITFKAPQKLDNYASQLAEISFRSTVAGQYVTYDGVQFVEGKLPVTYIPDDEAWRIRRGGADKYPSIVGGDIEVNKITASNLDVYGKVNNYNVATVRDGTTNHSEAMLFQNRQVSIAISGTQAYIDVTFPVAFDATPVWVIAQPVNASSTMYCTGVYNINAKGCRVYITHILNQSYTGSIAVNVVACGKKIRPRMA